MTDPDEDSVPPAPRPQPYPIEEALEHALAPELGSSPAEDESEPWPDDSDPAPTQPASSASESATSTATRPVRISDQLPRVNGAASGTDPVADGILTPRDLLTAVEERYGQARDAELLRLAPWQRRCVLSLRTFGVVSLACHAANISRKTYDTWRARDKAFAAAIADAIEDSMDTVEAAVRVSATVGDLEPVYQGQVLVGHKRRKSVHAAELLLKARRPAVFDRGTTLKLSGDLNVTVDRAPQIERMRGATPLLIAQAVAAGKPVLDSRTGDRVA